MHVMDLENLIVGSYEMCGRIKVVGVGRPATKNIIAIQLHVPNEHFDGIMLPILAPTWPTYPRRYYITPQWQKCLSNTCHQYPCVVGI